MPLKIQITLPYNQNIKQHLYAEHPSLVDYRICAESLDARAANKGRVPLKTYVVELLFLGEKFASDKEKFPQLKPLKAAPIIIGAGPCGLFAAMRFGEYGIPTILLERGQPAAKRMKAIARFWRYGEFEKDNNVCFGEGGAGLFSDGKLMTRIKSPYVQYVMDKLVDMGAPANTSYLANPHLGSNKIRQLIENIASHLKASGHQIRYQTRVEKIIIEDNCAIGVELNSGEKIYSDHIIMAFGHSASEMYTDLSAQNVPMAAKDMAVGVRMEHPRALIDKIQHGQFCADQLLETSRYGLKYHNKQTGRGTFSFCMCPGGYVLSSGTDADGLVTNGMSNYSRNSPWSNSAVVVAVKAGEDYLGDNLAGLKYLREIENKAYQISKEFKSGKELPAQKIKDFLQDKKSKTLNKSSCPSKLFSVELKNILPEIIVTHLKDSLLVFNRRMQGLIGNEGQLIAPETRTSSPVTILRDNDTLCSTKIKGLYPAGEGAGYAGGITSAAVDGVRVCMAILKSTRQLEK